MPGSTRRLHPVLKEWLLLTAALAVLAFLVPERQLLWRLEHTVYDAALTMWGRKPDPGIVIVAIDDAGLQQIGPWPWRRAVHATVINRLTDAGAKAVFIDITMDQPDPVDPAGDQALANAIRRNGRVILPVRFGTRSQGDREVPQIVQPYDLFRVPVRALGHIYTSVDPDGVVRDTDLVAGLGETRYRHAMIEMLQAGGEATAIEAVLKGIDPTPGSIDRFFYEGRYRIPYLGQAGSFPAVPYTVVLAGSLPADALRGKYVLIGSTAQNLLDHFTTPRSDENRRLMPGVEIHANILMGLREGVNLRVFSRTQTALLAAALVIGLMLIYLRVSARTALLVTLGIAFTVLVGAMLLFRGAQVWIQPSYMLVPLLLAYPLWSWRRLEATQRYLDDELGRLTSEPEFLPMAQAASTGVPGMAAIDQVERRIEDVRAAADRLRNLKRFVTDCLEQLPDGALVTDVAGKVVLATDRAAMYLEAESPNALVGKRISTLFEELIRTDGESWTRQLDPAFSRAETVYTEARKGDKRDLLVRAGPVYNARAQQAGVIVGLTDITALRNAERRKEEILRIMTHDMRSPQASILTLLDLHENEPDAMPVEQIMTRIARYARRTLSMADGFLKIAKAEALARERLPEVDLSAIVGEAVDEVWPQAKTKSIRFQRKITVDDLMMRGDRDLLTRATINMLTNAVKYSPPNTVVEVTANRDGDQAFVEIRDQGYGIAAEDLPKLFGKFVRVGTSSRTEDGVGLGLAMVKAVVESHGGTIKVESSTEPPTRGTAFRLRFPLTADGRELPDA